MPSRFYSQKDIDTFDKFNKELVGDLYTEKDGIIYQPVIIYKVSVYDTEVNMYGESADGKVYKPGVQVSCLVEADDQTTTTDEFGPDEQQNATFNILRQTLIDVSLVPEVGDVFEWNWAYFEIESINENQLIGGLQDNNWTVTCNTFRVRFSNLNIERIRSI